nr:ABC transporter permease [FCB group bacterium]
MSNTIQYLLRRLGFYLVAAWAALTLNFFIPRLMPGDPATIIFARFRGKLQPEAMVALRETFGLTDEPVIGQYFTYLKNLLAGDLGISIAYFPQQVSEVIGTALMWTLFLAGTSLIISFSLGTLLGTHAAWKRGGKLDSM